MSGALRELFIAIGVDTDDIDAAEKKVGNLGERFKKLAKTISDAFGGPYVQAALAFLIHKIAELGTEIRNQAAQIGVTTDELQRLRFASESAGMEADGLAQSITKLGRKASEAARNGGDQAKLFTRLGISLKDANGNVRPGVDLFRDAADAIAGMSNPSDRAAAAMALFEEEGARMLPMLQQGSAGLDRLGADFESLGGGLSDETIASIAEFNAQWARMKLAMLSVVSKISGVLFPAFSWLASMFAKLSAGVSRMVGGSKLLESAFVVLGAIAVRSLLRILAAHSALLIEMVLTWGPPVLAVMLLIAILDDLWVMFRGGNSVIGEMLDALFGLGTASTVVDTLKTAFSALGTVVSMVFEGVKSVVTALGRVGVAMEDMWSKLPAPLRSAIGRGLIGAIPGVGGVAAAADVVQQFASPSSPPVVRAPAAAGNSTNVNARNQVNITVQGTADGRTVDAIAREITRQMEEHARSIGDLSPRAAQ